MKKKLAALILVTLCFCSCNRTAQTTEYSTTTTTTDTPAATTVQTTSTDFISQTTTVKTTNITTTTTVETTQPIDYSNFSLLDYYGDFDEAEPMHYTIVNFEPEEDTNPDRYNIAFEAIINSEYYTELIEQTATLFTYENGEITPKSESWFNWGYEDCLSYDENKGFVVTPVLIDNIYLDFDLQNKETLFVFRLPIIGSQIEWSGTSVFYLPVYVNSKNEAHIIHDTVAQSLYGTTLIKFEDGYHLLFDRGHTAGTSRSHIYSVKNGKPKFEYEGTYINYHDEGVFFTNDHSGGLGYARVGFFRDKIRDCYCGVEALCLDSEAEQAIINSEKVKAEFGDIKSRLFVVGGQYIMMPMADCFRFENGELIDADIGINCPPDKDDFDIVLNIDFSEYQ